MLDGVASDRAPPPVPCHKGHLQLHLFSFSHFTSIFISSIQSGESSVQSIICNKISLKMT